jgi:thiamine pyrophosphokinase
MPAEGIEIDHKPSPAEGFLMHERAILFINGEVKAYGFLSALVQDDDYLVAVDGGLRHLLAIDRQPQLLIGDLDSVTSQQLKALSDKGVEVLRFPVEKNETDLELALLETCRRGCKSLLLVGALGGRIDQMLANLFLLLLPKLEEINVRIVESDQELFIIHHQAPIEGNPGDTVSLLPLKDHAEGVTTTGLQYPLINETLYLEHSRGISNRMLESRAGVVLEKGTLLCIHSYSDRKEIQ